MFSFERAQNKSPVRANDISESHAVLYQNIATIDISRTFTILPFYGILIQPKIQKQKPTAIRSGLQQHSYSALPPRVRHFSAGIIATNLRAPETDWQLPGKLLSTMAASDGLRVLSVLALRRSLRLEHRSKAGRPVL